MKPYRYERLNPTLADEKEVVIEVKNISDGNTSQTTITTQNGIDRTINESGKASIGLAKDLRRVMISIGTKVSNLAKEEDSIKINYYLNGKLLVEHNNPKSDSEQPRISITLHVRKP